MAKAKEKICPKCGIKSKGMEKIKKVFGIRKYRGKDHIQSYCRECRKNP